MGISLIAAKVLAVYLVISGLFLLLRGKTLPIILKDFFQHPAIVYLSGVILTIFGLFMVMRGVYGAGGWYNWVTLFGALALVKGIVYIFAPKTFADMHIERSRGFVVLTGLIVIALGAWLFCINY